MNWIKNLSTGKQILALALGLIVIIGGSLALRSGGERESGSVLDEFERENGGTVLDEFGNSGENRKQFPEGRYLILNNGTNWVPANQFIAVNTSGPETGHQCLDESNEELAIHYHAKSPDGEVVGFSDPCDPLSVIVLDDPDPNGCGFGLVRRIVVWGHHLEELPGYERVCLGER